MSELLIGNPAPDFALPASTGKKVKLSQFAGKKVVLFFYPQDLTPTCTAEACDFRDGIGRFRRNGAVVLGISPDPVKQHNKFAEQYELPYPLLSDEELQVCKLYDVWKLKKLYGREYMGVQRSTFLIDRDGRLVQEWRNVRIKGHVDAVLAAVKALG
ncbi:thioredoxin-dependent thiol peroxidase [Paenibacillus hemerocallicola]|uniref:thioredoxin-dependent peroxiredoxin n=1 Tax=Paenibacillus hemerocallicola TaxID=1172614 RepID=A0A5C4SXU5_9BACL|nr:thioredoxin-dependent thiol peroxidase [Paenibacillus hemerocallicola]TNJ56032.1 thioredoxin-dependent thiol peroxidase [Paenibacillus hemerocallicola]